jgi:DNA-binding beta-propeller fold protein YncE
VPAHEDVIGGYGEKWSTGGGDAYTAATTAGSGPHMMLPHTYSPPQQQQHDSLQQMDTSTTSTNASRMQLTGSGRNESGGGQMFRAPNIKRQKMIYHCKFGEFGILEGQFTEPSGVAVGANNTIVVADTNNHRIQAFDAQGQFKFAFGECGKRDAQLLYPNR